MQSFRTLIVVSLLVCFVATGVAFAQPGNQSRQQEVALAEQDAQCGQRQWGKRGWGRGKMDRLLGMLPADVQEPAQRILLEHRQETFALKQLAKAREHELQARIVTPNTSEAEITALISEITSLKRELLEAEVAMRQEFHKATGFPLPNRGWGKR